jgi:predicted NBD/HSP70 family sugar kinase
VASAEAPETLRQLRERNLTRILTAVAAAGEARQSDLPDLTELATGAVSSMVNQLLEGDLLAERTIAASSRGRPARALRIADHWADAIGVTITRDGIVAEAQTLTGRRLGTYDAPIQIGESPDQVSERIAALIAPVIREHGRPGGECVIAISIPGRPFDTIGSLELEWINEPVSLLLRPLHAAGFSEVLVGNDGSFAAVGEVAEGRGRGLGHVVVLLLERGLGGSAIVDGSLVSGFRKPAGWGHIPLEAGGLPCGCGLRGCAEQYFSLEAMSRDLREEDVLARSTTAGYADTLVQRARAHDRRVLGVLQTARERLAHLCDVLAGSFDPDKIILTGHGMPLGPWLLSQPAGVGQIPVERGDLAGAAPLVGALATARRARFENPLFAPDVEVG